MKTEGQSTSPAPAGAREAAFLSLVKIETLSKYSNLELDAAIKSHGLAGAERGLFTTLVYGVIERRITLDHIIGLFARESDMDGGVRQILRLGIYQIMYLDRVPDSAACNESVELCKRRFSRGAAGFVNAVLRSVCRSKAEIPSRMPSREQGISYLSVKYSVGVELCEMWAGHYGFDKTERILTAFSRVPPMTLRANTLKIPRDGLIESLRSAGTAALAAPSPHGVTLPGGARLEDLPQFGSGLCFVQDTASQFCAAAVGARPGELVVDCCAAPGGKSFGMAMDMENIGRVISLDLHENKLSLIRSGGERLGITIIEAARRDGRTADPELAGKADRVLCDVPCSGFGVLAKKPELRYKSPRDAERLPETQYAILCAGAEYVKPGGTLVYSTCTLNPAENERVAERFAAEHPDFAAVGVDFGGGTPESGAAGSLTIFPDDERFNSDGFFIAKFVRK